MAITLNNKGRYVSTWKRARARQRWRQAIQAVMGKNRMVRNRQAAYRRRFVRRYARNKYAAQHRRYGKWNWSRWAKQKRRRYNNYYKGNLGYSDHMYRFYK